jgi:hypothetical protein
MSLNCPVKCWVARWLQRGNICVHRGTYFGKLWVLNLWCCTRLAVYNLFLMQWEYMRTTAARFILCSGERVGADGVFNCALTPTKSCCKLLDWCTVLPLCDDCLASSRTNIWTSAHILVQLLSQWALYKHSYGVLKLGCCVVGWWLSEAQFKTFDLVLYHTCWGQLFYNYNYTLLLW